MKNNSIKWVASSILMMVLVVLVALGVEAKKGKIDESAKENTGEDKASSMIDVFADISFVDVFDESEASEDKVSSEEFSKEESLESIENSSQDFESSEDNESKEPDSSEPESSEPESSEPESSEPESSEPESSKPESSESESSEPESSEPESSEIESSEPESSENKEFPSDVTLLSGGKEPFVYFQQDSPQWNDLPYGKDKIGSHGCGPVNMAMVISTITGKVIYPDEAAKWSYKNGHYASGVGTAHSLMTDMAASYGVKVETIEKGNWNAVTKALKEGKYVITRVKSGIFATNNHFLTIRGITDDGKYLIANSISEEDSRKEWTLSTLKGQVNLGFWVYG